MAYRISEKDVDNFPGLRAKLEAARAAQNPAPKPKRRPKAKEAAGGSSVYVECDVAAETAGAPHWVLALPDLELINANDRPHWTKRAKLTAAIRAAAAQAAGDAGVPRLNRARVLYLVHPSARTRVFDPSNWALSAKAAVDGLSDAGVWADDNAAVVTGVDPRAGARAEGANIRLTLVVIDQEVPRV